MPNSRRIRLVTRRKKETETGPEVAEMMEPTGKDVKIAVINLINGFKDIKAKHELDYERNGSYKRTPK